MTKFTMLVGLPGSGKSTIARQLNDIYGTIIVSPDIIRKDLTGDMNNQSRNTAVFKIAENIIYESVFNKKDVVLDATNIHRFARMNLINKIRTCCRDCVIDCIVVVPTIEEVKTRNAQRERVVPDEVIDRMLSHWETPMEFEGFDHIYINHSGDASSNELLAYDRVADFYGGDKFYYICETEETIKYQIDFMRFVIDKTYNDRVRFDDIIRADVVVASAFVRCGFNHITDLESDELRCKVSAYKALTYNYDGLFVNPLDVSYMVESYLYPAEEWIRWQYARTFSCVNDLHNAHMLFITDSNIPKPEE